MPGSAFPQATARRDLRVLVREKKITRTYGGALGNFDATFASFADRRAVDYDVKASLAQKARGFIRENTTCFFDSGTTVFALAEALYREPVAGLRAVTNSLPVAEMLGRAEVEVHLLGGRFLQRQSILLGPAARQSARLWKFDLVFLGAEGFSQGGIWASEARSRRVSKDAYRPSQTRHRLCALGQAWPRDGSLPLAVDVQISTRHRRHAGSARASGACRSSFSRITQIPYASKIPHHLSRRQRRSPRFRQSKMSGCPGGPRKGPDRRH